MSLKNAERLVVILAIVVSIVFALLFDFSLWIVRILAWAMLSIPIIFALIFMRCPHCGKPLK